MHADTGRDDLSNAGGPRSGETSFNPPRYDAIKEAVESFRRQLLISDPILIAFNDCPTPMVVCDPTLPDDPLVYVNAAFEKMTGFTAAEVLGRNCWFMQGPLTDRSDVERLGRAVRRRERIELNLINYRRDGTRFWNRQTVSPVSDEAGEVRWFVASHCDVTTERQYSGQVIGDNASLETKAFEGQEALAERETRLTLALALQAGSLGTWSFDPRAKALTTSDACKSIFGRTPDQPLTFEDFLDIVHPEDIGRVQAALTATIENDAPYNLEYRILTPGGEQRWVHVQAALQPRARGSILAISGFVTDISVRKHAEEHRAVLTRELTHRVKNTLATVSAVVAQTLRDASSLDDARSAVAGRIASLATAHDLLVEGEIEGAAVSEIVARVLAPFVDRHGERFSIEGPPVRLSPEITLALSMTLYELATNAIKYGSLSSPSGHVTIEWSLLGAVEDRRFSFSWKEEDGPPVTPPSRGGFGTRMIERVLASHLRVPATLVYPPTGAIFSFEVPV